MKKLVNTISPYLLLFIPVFIGLLILLFNPNNEMLEQKLAMHATFIKIPQVNVFQIIVSFFKLPL